MFLEPQAHKSNRISQEGRIDPLRLQVAPNKLLIPPSCLFIPFSPGAPCLLPRSQAQSLDLSPSPPCPHPLHPACCQSSVGASRHFWGFRSPSRAAPNRTKQMGLAPNHSRSEGQSQNANEILLVSLGQAPACCPCLLTEEGQQETKSRIRTWQPRGGECTCLGDR